MQLQQQKGTKKKKMNVCIMEEISQCDMSLFQQNECMRFSCLMTLWHRINQNDNCNKIHTRKKLKIFLSVN